LKVLQKKSFERVAAHFQISQHCKQFDWPQLASFKKWWFHFNIWLNGYQLGLCLLIGHFWTLWMFTHPWVFSDIWFKPSYIKQNCGGSGTWFVALPLCDPLCVLSLGLLLMSSLFVPYFSSSLGALFTGVCQGFIKSRTSHN
jgi:hypothetical protein